MSEHTKHFEVSLTPRFDSVTVTVDAEDRDAAASAAMLQHPNLVLALEDNHVPNGKVRNFWRYVADNLSGMQCACVAVEAAISEDKGDFVWRGA